MQEKRFAHQIAIILAENDRRRREIPPDFYSLMHLPNLFMTTQRNRSLLRLLKRGRITTLAGQRILDVGCGSGEWLLDFLSWGATPELLSGIDIDPRQIAEAAPKLPQADLRVGNAAELPWADASFDIVVQATLFSSILDLNFQKAIAAEMMRVTKPGGLILWYDSRFDNPWNRHVRGIRAREVKRLFPGCSFRLKRATLLPPLARKVVPVSWLVAQLLEQLPFLRTHILGSFRLPPQSPELPVPKSHPVGAFPADGTSTDREIHYSPMSNSLAKEVAELHALCFRDFFLTGLGHGILTLYYRHYHGRPDSISFVARDASGKVIGFVAGSRNYGEFVRSFYRAHFLPLALATVKAFFLRSDLQEKIRQRTSHIKAAIRSLFENQRPTRRPCSSGALSAFETGGLASVAVHPDFRGKGVAVELFRLFEEYAKRLGVRKAELSVLASNARAIAFYKKVGWHIASYDEDYVVFEKML